RSADAAHLVDTDGAGEDERVVLVWADLDAVRVAHPEPARRHLGHLVAVALELVLVIDDVALRLEVGAALDLDRVAVAQRRDERLLERCHRLAVSLDLHLVADVELLLLDREELLAARGISDPARTAQSALHPFPTTKP